MFKMERKLLDLFLDKTIDSTLRGMAVEILVSRSLGKYRSRLSKQMLKGIVQGLARDVDPAGKEFSGFTMNRLYQLSSGDPHLKRLLG